nr:RWD domain-containing protein 1-like [Saimiri boliviensis boliviensis]
MYNKKQKSLCITLSFDMMNCSLPTVLHVVFIILALQAEENLGVVMIFTLVTAVPEKLNEIVDQIKTRREEEKKQKEKEAKEAEKQLFHDTSVTIDNFLNWKAKFDAELLEIKKKRMKEGEQAGKNKLSGKQLFETDHNLDTSDIQFLEDAGNNVEVDESLFQEMDDLELEDDEDDPDDNPADPESDGADEQTVPACREA